MLDIRRFVHIVYGWPISNSGKPVYTCDYKLHNMNSNGYNGWRSKPNSLEWHRLDDVHTPAVKVNMTVFLNPEKKEDNGLEETGEPSEYTIYLHTVPRDDKLARKIEIQNGKMP